jgi:Uma2 family endonuclease
MPELVHPGEPAVLTQEAARRMSRADFLAWAETQPAKYERVDGRVVRMNAERGAHVRMKGALFIALREAARASGAACQVLIDGATVATGDCDYEPDATVNLGEPMGAHALIVPRRSIPAESSSTISACSRSSTT